jgi:hypothetical protein
MDGPDKQKSSVDTFEEKDSSGEENESDSLSENGDRISDSERSNKKSSSRLPTNEEFFGDMKPEIMMNKGDDLPFGYFSPASEGKVSWICGEDANGKITSVFIFQDGTRREKKVDYLANKEEALAHRALLIKDGWKVLEPPKIVFTHPVTGKQFDHLSRQQKRQLAKKLKEMAKKNPSGK